VRLETETEGQRKALFAASAPLAKKRGAEHFTARPPLDLEAYLARTFWGSTSLVIETDGATVDAEVEAVLDAQLKKYPNKLQRLDAVTSGEVNLQGLVYEHLSAAEQTAFEKVLSAVVQKRADHVRLRRAPPTRHRD
jgi:hypothetical protein